ncbi:uncharacterized protein LOC132313120 [Cornus florida]|uniref:uncharacterized protein LOC132313120 n=1 Tax=Cornus florida TaxID=4283 RepID=UPI00289759AB|nr:uncharacterized protein LOC132313120 [Cornus florida]
MSMRGRASFALLPCLILLSRIPGFISSAIVTLDSIEIFNTHEWLTADPTVYFHCKRDHKTDLPDVKKANVLYSFKGEESWQPLTKLKKEKCKRCGFYEKDSIKSDDILDEWEFCPSYFTDSDGKYNHFKDKEFNATFSCPNCESLGSDSDHSSSAGGKGMHWALVIVISIAVSAVFILGLVAGYKYWQKRKREQDQARFLKLFEDDDDIEDELGIGPIGSVL